MAFLISSHQKFICQNYERQSISVITTESYKGTIFMKTELLLHNHAIRYISSIGKQNTQ